MQGGQQCPRADHITAQPDWQAIRVVFCFCLASITRQTCDRKLAVVCDPPAMAVPWLHPGAFRDGRTEAHGQLLARTAVAALPSHPLQTPTCTFDPPHSTPISRMIATAASRRRWYSLSVSVWAGAMVIESPAPNATPCFMSLVQAGHPTGLSFAEVVQLSKSVRMLKEQCKQP